MPKHAGLGYNYLGTIDDVVERYPWRFEITPERLTHSLAVQLIDGRPILLNDGYLVNHPVCREAIMDQNSLLWEMIRKGFVHVMARGKDRYGLHEMPERMKDHVESFRLLVEDRRGDVRYEWKDIRMRLEEVDRILEGKGNIISWPSYDAGSGYLALTRYLKEKQVTATSAGVSWYVTRNHVFQDFLSRFADRMRSDTSGARTYWEELAKQYANNPDYVKQPRSFVGAMMSLANELYHYNMGVMLAADRDDPVAVETQVSPAFDSVLAIEELQAEEVFSAGGPRAGGIPEFPKLQVPKAVLAAPREIAKVLKPYEKELEKLGQAREKWLELKVSYRKERRKLDETDGSGLEKEKVMHELRRLSSEASDAAKEYAARLAEHLAPSVEYKRIESGVSYLTGAATTGAIELATTGIPLLGSMVGGLATGYVVALYQDKGVGKVTEKFRVKALESQMRPDGLLAKSKRAIGYVKDVEGQRAPSAIDIDKRRAAELTAGMTRFNPS